jgi:hypothetical protein
MCNHCSSDPRDRIAQAERALWGLRHLINQLEPGEELNAEGIGSIVTMIHEQLEGAATEVQTFVPRTV